MAIHLAQLMSGRHSRGLACLAYTASLLGVFAERAALVSAGNASGDRPVDYFRFTGSPDADRSTALRFGPDLPRGRERPAGEERRQAGSASPEAPGRVGISPSREREPIEAEPPLAEQLRRARVALDEAMELPGSDLGDRVDGAGAVAARLREHLISRLRHDPAGPAAERRRAALEKANVIISLLAGLEYPVSGVQRNLLEQARTALRVLIDQDVPGLPEFE
jgi:hypothetical protein